MTCDNYKTEALIKVTGSHVLYTLKLWEMMQEWYIVTTQHYDQLIAPVCVTSSDLQGHSRIVGLFKWDFCTVVQQLACRYSAGRGISATAYRLENGS